MYTTNSTNKRPFKTFQNVSFAAPVADAGTLLATVRTSHKLIAHELAVPPMISSQREALVPLSSLPAQKKAAMHKQRT